MEFSEATDEIFPALCAAQRALSRRIGKNATANTGKFKYDYVTLEEVMDYVQPACEANGLMIIQGSATQQYDESGTVAVATVIVHVVTGQFIRTRFAAATGSGDNKVSAQQAGIVISYGRRYDLLGLFNLTPVGEDTDANSAGSEIFFKASAPPGKYTGPTVPPVPAAAPAPPDTAREPAPEKKPGKAPGFGKKTASAKTGLPSSKPGNSSAFSFQPKD